MKKTIGGDRLGSGKRMKVELHGYERSTHDLGYLWRSTMSAGTLVPFMVELGLPGDTFDINLDCDIKTHPTVGPLFGSYKVQLDVFTAPIRLYQAMLHNNKLGIGLNMENVILPFLTLYADDRVDWSQIGQKDIDNSQINPSALLSYLGIRGVGIPDGDHPTDLIPRTFNGVPFLAYWDIYKNYYANKQEGIGMFIHYPVNAVIQTIDDIQTTAWDGAGVSGTYTLEQVPPNAPRTLGLRDVNDWTINYTGAQPRLDQIVITLNNGSQFRMSDKVMGVDDTNPGVIAGQWTGMNGVTWVNGWDYYTTDGGTTTVPTRPNPTEFDLDDIDRMRELILANIFAPFNITDIAILQDVEPYKSILDWTPDNLNPYLTSQEGLALKTYQSDLFNNWLSEEWIDGTNGINEITAIDTSGGSFTIDTFLLSKKVYDMLNRIAVSGGSYDDWLDAVYTHDRYTTIQSPVYQGGLIKELVFQEVVSNAEAVGTEQQNTGSKPLGTLAGKGILGQKRKGGQMVIKVDEPSYIIGLVSLTPRIDYSQGNKWDVHLKTMNDLHKPALDEIGFQDLITEQMAWWTTDKIVGQEWNQKSAGKQPAWINYMTNVNQVRGNFAIKDNEMFMTLNRKYERLVTNPSRMEDLTTYIDPEKFNNSFAETSLDAQNFWTQISADITARRKMSAKIMPNL